MSEYAEKINRDLRGQAIRAFRLNRGLMVEIDSDYDTVEFKPSMFVPWGQVWTNRGSKIVAPQEWIDEAKAWLNRERP